MFSWLMNRWRSRQRAIDIAILWPSCRDQAPDLNIARVAFAYHAFRDPAWIVLGEDEIVRRIDLLT